MIIGIVKFRLCLTVGKKNEFLISCMLIRKTIDLVLPTNCVVLTESAQSMSLLQNFIKINS